MDAKERATNFVNRYPAMFTDKWFWIDTLELEFLNAERDELKRVVDFLQKKEEKK